ncbi:MAG: efflux transporter outer membrane subunit [Proteobacteria bacterium]|nr:efflux transporter outer membrane subunit [Pseudomonadota bacterium]
MARILILLAALTVSACTLVPPLRTPEVPTAQGWKDAGGQGVVSATIPAAWWQGYGNADLNHLEEQAAAANTDIEAAQARVRQARAALTQAGAALLPKVDASLGTSKRFDDGATDTTFNTNAGATLSYEVDLFGGNRAARQAAVASLQGTQFAGQATRLAVQGDVASGWFAVIGARERMQLTSQSLAFAEDILRLTEVRRQAGVLSDVELSQQQNQVASLRAAKLAQGAQAQLAENALAVLLGQSASMFSAPSGTLVSLTVPEIPLNGPAEVVMRRPDIRAAEASLRAANANIGVARAALFPQLSLSLSGALAIDPTAPEASIGASLLAPIFHGGSLWAGVTLSQEREAELVATYRATVLNALREVEDALANVNSLRGQLEQQQVAAESARTTAKLAQLRFDNGVISMLELLDAQRTLLSSVSALAQTRQDYLTATVNLIRALGGEG